MSFRLEFYSLSWNTLKSALIQRKPELIRAVQERQWDRLLTDTDLARNNDDKGGLGMGPEAIFADGFDEIADAMAAKLPPRGDPPDIGDNAALVIAATIRQLGKPVGAISHRGSVVRDKDGEFPLDFRAMFLDGVAGACFKDHELGDKLAARPLFGLFHLDFLSWGGLSQREVGELLGRYALPPDIKQDEDWQAVAQNAEAWLNETVKSLKAAAAAKTDLVTLYLTAPEHYSSYRAELQDEVLEDFSFIGKIKSFIGRYI
ncbi:MAG TPA: hypothetical protein VF930_07820 [Stellaceae bacterium]